MLMFGVIELYMVLEDSITGRRKFYHVADQDAMGATTFFFLAFPLLPTDRVA